VEIINQIFGLLAVALGMIFSFLGVLGYLRLPDVYTRLHATGKVGIYGGVLLALGSAVSTPSGVGKSLVLVALLLLYGPVVSHALASAAYRLGVPLHGSDRDELAAQQPSSGKVSTGAGVAPDGNTGHH
jgi:multicomponent Na+:H+ antiporter subunit G